nr:uncharacterized protein LOC129262430 [Lytechinus pictus]XP_054756523.1 uncharacterized protein LOC129262430 [Lytechinus pictus]
MGPRRTLAKLTYITILVFGFICGILNFQHLWNIEPEIPRTRLSLSRKTGHGKLQKKDHSLGSGSESWLNFPSLRVEKRPAGEKEMDESAEEEDIMKLREDVEIALLRLEMAKRLRHRDVSIKYPGNFGQAKLKAVYTSEDKSPNTDDLHQRTEQHDTRKHEIQNNGIGIDKLFKKLNDIDDYLEKEEDAVIKDDPNLNADVERAVPVLNVKRYVDEPVDPHEYNYIYNPSHVCLDKDGHPRRVFIIFLVVTAPGHFQRRHVVRHTYGDQKQWPALKRGIFATVFLLGKTFNATLQRMIDEEAQKHNDILQEDFIDTYANLSRKTVMGLKWVTNHCRHAYFAMKIDDDSMINQGRFLWIFKESSFTNWTASETMWEAPVLRSNLSKYYISKEYYPAPTYPPYMNGPGYVMSSDLVEAGYHMALKTPLFPWEDVFLGTCFKKMGFKPVQHKRFLWISDPGFFTGNSERTIVTSIRSYVVVSNLHPDTMKFVWFTCKIKLIKPR